MVKQKALPVIMTVRNPQASLELREAFVIGERAERAIIEKWAGAFDFETVSPEVVVEIDTDKPVEKIVKSILQQVKKTGSDGVVIAGAAYLKRARLAEKLPDALSESKLLLWNASTGSLPTDKEEIERD